jgi:hypothetical protein
MKSILLKRLDMTLQSVNQPYLKSVLLERLDMTLQSVHQPYLKSVLLERLDMLDMALSLSSMKGSCTCP